MQLIAEDQEKEQEMKEPVIVDLNERIDMNSILKPKIAPAKRMTKEQIRMMEAYKLFQLKYV